MRIALIALGTRGDVQPYIALGKGLAIAGHIVRLLTHQNFEKLVTSQGVDFWPVKGDVQDVMGTPEMQDLLEKGNFLAINARAAKEAEHAALDWARDGMAGCAGMDLILVGLGGFFIALAVAEKLDIPLMQAYLVPFVPTRAFPSVLLPTGVPRLGGLFNLATHHLTRQMMWQGSRSADRVARQQALDLPATPFRGPYNSERLSRLPTLFGYSPSVLPGPPDWDGRQQITGYWFLDAESDWMPPPALEAFLESGPPPIYIGFGSMVNRKPKEMADMVLRAIEQTGERAILLSGWGGLSAENVPETVFVIDSVPHSWLFPRVAAVVHHGGAGTTAAGLRAGIPSIITPFFGDQYFWGQRVAELGVGPAPLPRKRLTAESLAQAVRSAVSDTNMRETAAQLGANIRSEDGVARAVDIISATRV